MASELRDRVVKSLRIAHQKAKMQGEKHEYSLAMAEQVVKSFPTELPEDKLTYKIQVSTSVKFIESFFAQSIIKTKMLEQLKALALELQTEINNAK